MDKYFHPNPKLLEDFSKGILNPGISVLVSSHLEHCEKCFFHTESLYKKEARDLEQMPNNVPYDLEEKFEELSSLLEMEEVCQEPKAELPILNFKDKKFPLPAKLGFTLKESFQWKEFGKNSAIAPVLTTDEGNLYFIYLDKGEKVPSHGHEGVEYSYVVAGSYESDQHSLQTGDFSTYDGSDDHSPLATSDDGCLVVSWVEKRLTFLPRWLAPLNNLLWWYLHKA